MPDFEDYYDILGINPKASSEEITKAWKDKFWILAPDRMNGAPETAKKRAEGDLKKVNNAYDILKDPKKRHDYDHQWHQIKDKPKPVVDPQIVHFDNVNPKEIKTGSFIIRNSGGPYNRINISNPNTWVKVVSWHSITDSDELPLQVEIEAAGEDFDNNYSEQIKVNLDDEKTYVKIELQTRTQYSTTSETSTSTQAPSSSGGTPVGSPPTSSSGSRNKRGRGLLVFACISVVIIVIAGVFLSNSNRSNVPIRSSVPIPSSSSLPMISKTSIIPTVALSSVMVQQSPSSQHVVKIGSTIQFVATGFYSDGSIVDVSSQVTWATSYKSIATISSKGLATCVGNGTAYISATMDGITSHPVTLTVPVTLSSINLMIGGPTIVGSHVPCGAMGYYSDGSSIGINSQVIWTSSNTAIATISPTGIATLIAVGTTNITATLDGISTTEPLSVRLAK